MASYKYKSVQGRFRNSLWGSRLTNEITRLKYTLKHEPKEKVKKRKKAKPTTKKGYVLCKSAFGGEYWKKIDDDKDLNNNTELDEGDNKF